MSVTNEPLRDRLVFDAPVSGNTAVPNGQLVDAFDPDNPSTNNLVNSNAASLANSGSQSSGSHSNGVHKGSHGHSGYGTGLPSTWQPKPAPAPVPVHSGGHSWFGGMLSWFRHK